MKACFKLSSLSRERAIRTNEGTRRSCLLHRGAPAPVPPDAPRDAAAGRRDWHSLTPPRHRKAGSFVLRNAVRRVVVMPRKIKLYTATWRARGAERGRREPARAPSRGTRGPSAKSETLLPKVNISKSRARAPSRVCVHSLP